ncbi:hypothetical protein IV498_01415 [Paenarthrobacter sp. Z7-10]|uniref:hypothetical protein n=1 Tax=Paenarthrobacter sp. Z7-10 TaxID=2787635 RepID=UPI0022A9A3EF|nr:hypothetical protein [Paenarthrobacter sp. Z7-10]MCZ2401873.1 hypothetical protein [Paenarthrobacter sp. Z7-10]
MIAALQWVALAACLICAVSRLPAAVNGKNVGLFWAFVLAAVAVGLSLRVIYLPVDAVLGGHNLANLVLRFALYAIFFVLASKLAVAYGSLRSQRLIRGSLGLCILIVISAGTLVLFLLSDLPVSSTGLAAYTGQRTVADYALLGKLYPVYAAACLIVPTGRGARTGATGMRRTAAALICAGLCMVVAATALELPSLPVTTLGHFLSYGSVIALAGGLTLVWIALRTDRRKAVRPRSIGGQHF